MFKILTQVLRRFTGSLSFKLSFYTGLLMFLALLAFAYHSIRSQELNLRDKITQAALNDSEVVKAAIWNGMMTNDREVIRAIVRTIAAGGLFENIRVFDSEGVLRYSSHAEQTEGDLNFDFEPLFQDMLTNTSVRHSISNDGKWLRVLNPVFNSESCSAAACHAHPSSQKVLGALAIKIPLQGVRDEIYSNARKTIVFAFLLFLLISTASGLAVIFLVNPSVKRLQENAAKMARGEYVPEIRSTGTDEMAELSRSFDEMSRTVTERTTRLAQGRKMYKSLFEEVPCYLTTVNRQYVITRANRAFREQFGAQVGKNCFVGYKCRDSKCPVCPVEATFADGQSHQSEETWQLGGSDVYVVVNTAPIFDDEGNIAEVLEMSLDVTRLKQLQMELEKKKDEYKYLFGHAPCYLTVVDRNFEVVQANKLFRKDFGERIGEKCYRVYKGRDSQCPVCPVEATFADAQSHQSEEIWRRNGQETNIIVNTAPVTDDKGEVNAVIEMCTNVTEVKRLQSELALLGETIASLSHSTKNILSGLQGGVYVVDSGLERDKPERVRQGWGMVKRNVEKISHLVEGILYASKEREPEYKQCDPGELLSDLCDLYEEKARAHGVRLVREFEKTMGAGLLDPAGIHSALSNLVSNALEACLARGKGSRCIKVSGRIQDSTLEMEVTDDGIGIPEEVRDKLFGKFYSTKGSRGTGLGLLITKKVIEEHGGTIAVESEQGRGTSFLIHIPFQRMQQANGLGTAV